MSKRQNLNKTDMVLTRIFAIYMLSMHTHTTTQQHRMLNVHGPQGVGHAPPAYQHKQLVRCSLDKAFPATSCPKQTNNCLCLLRGKH